MSFREKWLTAVEKKNSVLCAGLDPAEFEMGRGEKGLPEGASKLGWALRYVEAVAPHCAAIKYNIQYWKGEDDAKTLAQIGKLAHNLGMVVIDDSKLADIGETNDAGIFYAKKRGADAVTYSPFPGNIEEAAKQAKARDIGIISMCLMSNSEYEAEKNKLVRIPNQDVLVYDSESVFSFQGEGYVRQYLKLALDSERFGIDAIVIGAPSKKNHIKEEEIAKVRNLVSENMLVLLPGVGAQGGEAQAIWKYFGKDNVIVNVGRDLMFPKEMSHEEVARNYQNKLNSLRQQK